jgi:hypothetical protein
VVTSDFIETVVILFFENHTLDNIASDVAGAGGNTAHHHTDSLNAGA